MKQLIYGVLALTLTGCFNQVEEVEKKTNSNSQNVIQGTVSKLWSQIFPVAHASEICSSSKSSGAEVYVTLYKVTDTSKLGTTSEAEGLESLCDADLVNDNYKLNVDRAALGETPIIIKITDNRSNPVHKDKEIFTNPKATEFNVDKNKTVQSKLIVKKVKEQGLSAADVDFAEIDKLHKKFHPAVIEDIIEKNPDMNKDLSDLNNMVNIFDVKFDKIFEQLGPNAETIDDLGGLGALASFDFVVSDDDKTNIPEEDLCFMNATNESEVQACEAKITAKFAAMDIAMIAFSGYMQSNATDSPSYDINGYTTGLSNNVSTVFSAGGEIASQMTTLGYDDNNPPAKFTDPKFIEALKVELNFMAASMMMSGGGNHQGENPSQTSSMCSNLNRTDFSFKISDACYADIVNAGVQMGGDFYSVLSSYGSDGLSGPPPYTPTDQQCGSQIEQLQALELCQGFMGDPNFYGDCGADIPLIDPYAPPVSTNIDISEINSSNCGWEYSFNAYVHGIDITNQITL